MSASKQARARSDNDRFADIAIDSVCRHFDCSLEQLCGDNREAPLVRARMAAAVLLRDELLLGGSGCAKYMCKHHSTIHNLWARADRLVEVDKYFAKRLDGARDMLRERARASMAARQ